MLQSSLELPDDSRWYRALAEMYELEDFMEATRKHWFWPRHYRGRSHYDRATYQMLVAVTACKLAAWAWEEDDGG